VHVRDLARAVVSIIFRGALNAEKKKSLLQIQQTNEVAWISYHLTLPCRHVEEQYLDIPL
jgi:hypothetical protein